MNYKSLHISVAAVPNSEYGNPRILNHDLKLTKASILYADNVKICSMSTWMAASLYLFGNYEFPERQQIEILITFAKAMGLGHPLVAEILPTLQEIEKVLKKSSILLTKKERQTKSAFRKKLPEFFLLVKTEFPEILRKMGFDEIELAVNKGLLEIQPFHSMGSAGDSAKEYLALIEEMLSSSNTHPMLDEETNILVRLALEEGVMSVDNSVTKKSKQIGLVGDLFDRLPVFDLSMGELIDLRTELQPSLIRFRAEMATLSDNIENASWDKHFSSDVQETFQKKIEPALLEIEEELKSVRFQEFWSRRIVDKAGFLTATTAASYAMGAAVAPMAGVATALAGLVTFTKAGLADLKDRTNEIERNGLYFYYRIKENNRTK